MKKNKLYQNYFRQYEILCEDTPTTTTTTPRPLPQPRRKIHVTVYHPSPSDFITGFLSVYGKTSILRRVEPSICEELRSHLNGQLKHFHEQVLTQMNRFFDAVKRSKSNSVSDAITAVRNANDAVITAFVTASSNSLTEINDLCTKLNSTAAIRDVQKQLIQTRASQFDGAFKLSVIPQNCENEMQSNYVPLENIIDGL